MEVLCVQETKWKGDRVRKMTEARMWYEWRDGKGGSLQYG